MPTTATVAIPLHLSEALPFFGCLPIAALPEKLCDSPEYLSGHRLTKSSSTSRRVCEGVKLDPCDG
ncbi:hypothetical protein AALP_AA1G257100 [Arabis alpina]|uniref:Uncharacterized protein n=1 Tax=Arabis alpina TaxID=50452 RepID=A0A087HQP1_ARAAL|nr:hypothetical protein AALP_AA1G257100 [Arabis alpina]